MNTDFIKGVVVPILTPIDEEEKIDEARLRDQVDYVIEGGVLGILAFGSNGEFYVVEEDEMERGLKIMLDQAAGRVPVYFGIGAISTKKCCRLAKMAVEAGAAGISVLQPMFLKPTEAELYNHFKTIAESVPETPMLLYNNPGRVGYTMSAGLVERLAHEVPNIVGMKDTSGDITQTSEFIRRTRDVGFKVFGGKDTLLYASMCHGAVGGVVGTGEGRVAALVELTALEGLTRADFDGSDAVAGIPIAADVKVYNAVTETWVTLSQAKAFTDTFTAWYDRDPGRGGQVRVIVAGG